MKLSTVALTMWYILSDGLITLLLVLSPYVTAALGRSYDFNMYEKNVGLVLFDTKPDAACFCFLLLKAQVLLVGRSRSRKAELLTQS